MLMRFLLLLAAAQGGLVAAGPVTVEHVAFEPADLSVSYEQVVPLTVTYYKTQIVWRFSDGTRVQESLEQDWFFDDAPSYVAVVVPVSPPPWQAVVPPTFERRARYVRKPKTLPSAGSVLTDAQVVVVAAILFDGSAFGDPTTVRQVFAKRQALKREYDYWLRVFADAWNDDSAIATLRTIVPLLGKSRPDALPEKVRLTIKRAAQTMLYYAERDLSDAPRLLKALTDVIEQQTHFLRDQDGR